MEHVQALISNIYKVFFAYFNHVLF